MKWSNREFTRRLLRWYGQNRRDLPWRVPPNSPPHARPDAYRVFLSEMMLQQTQVATVVPYFQRFIGEFPTIYALASGNERQILRLWQGLGYYSRARNLRKAAARIVEKFGGELPADVEGLMALPGVGRYTAGAIASIAFDVRAPILDGNVARVLCRIDGIKSDPRQPVTRAKLWARAEEILPTRRVGDFNSAMMELGATICTPRNPRCDRCPASSFCKARLDGLQNDIPLRRKTRPTPLIKRWTFCIRNGERWLIEQRPSTGRWAGMWQFVTIAPAQAGPSARDVHRACSVRTDRPSKIGHVAHALTHRRYEFDVFGCMNVDGATRSTANCDRPRAWVRLAALHEYPLPAPHVRIAELLRATADELKTH